MVASVRSVSQAARCDERYEARNHGHDRCGNSRNRNHHGTELTMLTGVLGGEDIGTMLVGLETGEAFAVVLAIPLKVGYTGVKGAEALICFGIHLDSIQCLYPKRVKFHRHRKLM